MSGRAHDHVVVAVPDLEEAAGAMTQLGFFVTPRSDHPFGTSNRLVMLPECHVELVTVTDPSRLPPTGFARFVADSLAAERSGPVMVALQSADPEGDRTRLSQAGVEAHAPVRFGRTATLPDSSTARVEFESLFTDLGSDSFSAFFCRHLTPEYVWHPATLGHDNGADRLEAITVAHLEQRSIELLALYAATAAELPLPLGATRLSEGAPGLVFSGARAAGGRLGATTVAVVPAPWLRSLIDGATTAGDARLCRCPAILPPMERHPRGLLLTVVGVLMLVPDATLVRVIEADTITTTMWRNGLIAVTVTAVLVVRHGSRLPALIRQTGRAGLLSAALWGTTTSLFVAAVDTTTVGNTVLILALAPLWAALFSHWFVGEPIARRTWMAVPFAVAGVALAFRSSIGTGAVVGDLLALGASFGLAANLTVLRRHGEIDFVPAAAMGAWLAFVLHVLIGGSFVLDADDVVPAFALGVVFLPAAMMLITTGARFLPSPETALLLLLETILSPILAAVAIDEPLTGWTLLGGAVVLTTLIVHTLSGRAESRRRLAVIH